MRKLTLILEVDGQIVEREFKLDAVLEQRIDLHEVAEDMLQTIKELADKEF